MDARRLRYLEAMGIPAWVRRVPPAPSPAPDADAAAAPDPEAAPSASATRSGEAPAPAPSPDPAPSERTPEAVAAMDWAALEAAVRDCPLCEELVANRTQTVFGVGNREADWMVVGEAPGAEEDRRGEPFVGKAGKLLDNMLRAVGLSRETVYIANILKCRPPNNRDPRPEEAAHCEPYLKRQIALIEPKVILAVGRVAAQNLLKTDRPIGRLRGQVHRYGEAAVPVVVTYHPAYLLRSPGEKRKAWDDLRRALTELRNAGGR